MILATLVSFSSGDFVPKSILCDDIPAICEHYNLPYEHQNDTICQDKERFLSPKICNCDHKCIGYKDEGESCVISSPMFFPNELCGPELECLSDGVTASNAKCTKNPMRQCINESLTYDLAKLHGEVGPGQYKPNCDEYGRYAGRQCSPGSTCYCVNTKGERQFGEGIATSMADMNCACSSYWFETLSRGMEQGLRCLQNGNFDPLVCGEDMCYCYDYDNDMLDGPYPYTVMTELSCYDSKIHNENYNNVCHRDQMEWDSSHQENKTIVVDEVARPRCDYSGHYSPIQRIGSNAYCVDPSGNVIENFTLPLHQSERMTCNCARRSYIMEKEGLGASKPKCCPSGEYFPWQTRGLLSFCVDENGNQVGEEKALTDILNLCCHTTDNPCEAGASLISKCM